MTTLRPGGEVRVFPTRARGLTPTPINGYPGEVVKVGRGLVTVTWSYPERNFGATHTQTQTANFRIDTRYINNRTRLWFYRIEGEESA